MSKNAETVQTIVNYYDIEIDMLKTEHRLFEKFLKSHKNIVVKTASHVTKVLHHNQLCDLLQLLSKLASLFASNSALSATAEII